MVVGRRSAASTGPYAPGPPAFSQLLCRDGARHGAFGTLSFSRSWHPASLQRTYAQSHRATTRRDRLSASPSSRLAQRHARLNQSNRRATTVKQCTLHAPTPPGPCQKKSPRARSSVGAGYKYAGQWASNPVPSHPSASAARRSVRSYHLFPSAIS